MQRVTVAGGGVVGLSCALRLALAGHAVTVWDPAIDRAAASWGNAGHIATEQVAPLAAPGLLRSLPRRMFTAGRPLALPPRMIGQWLPFALRMLPAARPRRFAAGEVALASLLAEALPAWMRLADAIGEPDLVRANGHFVVWESPATAAAGRRGWRAADTGTARIADAASGELRRLRALGDAPIEAAIRFTGSGQIRDLDALAAALERALLAAGGRIVRRAARLRMEHGRVAIDGDVDALVLVAAGVRSGDLVAAVGHQAPLVAERGYHVRASAAAWPADLPPIVYEDRSMIVTRYADSVQAAGFVEFGHPDAPPDPRKWARLERHIAELGLPFEPPFARWMGSRPTLPDYLPAIGRSRRAANLLYAFGHQHLGLTLAPITAEIIAQLVADAPPTIDIAPFDIERFAHSSSG